MTAVARKRGPGKAAFAITTSLDRDSISELRARVGAALTMASYGLTEEVDKDRALRAILGHLRAVERALR